jgi:hypothetical protein
MSGIARIQRKREDLRRPQQQTQAPSREVWFKDGDQVFLSSIATGNEEDRFMDEINLYTFRMGNRWINLLKDETVDDSIVPEGTRASNKFAFWAYVHRIVHLDRLNDDWTAVEGPGGKMMYREDINDFRIVSLGFGRNDYVWDQLSGIYSDWGGLDKGVIRIKRSGAGLETSYTLSATPQTEEIPEERKAEITELPLVKEYFLERYGKNIELSLGSEPQATTPEKPLF